MIRATSCFSRAVCKILISLWLAHRYGLERPQNIDSQEVARKIFRDKGLAEHDSRGWEIVGGDIFGAEILCAGLWGRWLTHLLSAF